MNMNVEYESTGASKKSWIDDVVKKKGFNILDMFDTGMVRAKVAVKLPESSNEISVTMWKKDYIEERLSPWKKFQNKNVIPLLYTETLTDLNSELVYTIPPYCNLEEKVNSQGFKAAENAVCKTVDYIIEATQGLCYIHEQGYSHLNVKSSSFSLFNDGTVKVDQLHFLSPINSSTKRNGLLQSLCPPETYYDPEISSKYSSKFDSWSLGIMMIELFTGSYLTKKLPKYVDSWCMDVYPVIFKILKKKKFEKKICKVFPKARQGINLKSLRYLIANTLTLHPKNRPSIQEIHDELCNLIVMKNTGSYTGKPKIWKRKLYWIELMKETAQAIEEAREDLNETSMNVDKRALKITDEPERLKAKAETQYKDDLTNDPYTALRGEVLKYYGPGILQVSKDKDNESTKITPASECKVSIKKEGEFIRKEDLIKTDKECADHNINIEENYADRITWSLSGNILSKLKKCGDLTLKYVTDSWTPENPGTYLNKLSKQLTG